VTSSVIQEKLKGFDVRSVLDAVYPLLSNASSVAGLMTTVVMAVFFIAMDSMGIDKRMLMLLDVKPSLSASLSDFASGVRRYWVVATIFGLIVAFLDVIALAIIAVELIWVWGELAFLPPYMPDIGFVICLIPPTSLDSWVLPPCFGLIVAFLDGIALAIIDVPPIGVWGVLACLTNYIPNVGFVIGLIPPALLAHVDRGWQSALWVIIGYSVLNFVIQ